MRIMKSFFALVMTMVLIIVLLAGCGAAQSTCPRIGDRAPDFTFVGMDGKDVSLSAFAGKPVVINTWNLNCVECKREMPFFQEVYAANSARGLVVLSVNTLDGIGTSTKDFLAKSGYTFTVLYDKNQDIYKKFCCPKCADPYSFFVAADGTMKSFKIGGFTSKDELMIEVNKILPAY
jgi:peroxiredoxin